MADVPAVATAVKVLERIAEEWPRAVPSGVLINDLGLNRSTCYNILGTLERAGWATTVGARSGWSLGPRLLGLTGVPADAVTVVVQRELDELSTRLGFVVFAVRRTSAGEYLVFATAERGQGVRVTVSVGDSFQFSAPAIMQAFYAWTGRAEFARLVERHGLTRFTRHTKTSLDQVTRQLARARKHGYGTSVQEYDLAQSGVAAPVFDARGEVGHVICSLAFSSELDGSTVDAAGDLVRECADRITEQTGGRHPD